MISNLLHQIWLLKLQTWAAEGTLLQAALQALQLDTKKPPRRLQQLMEQIVDGDRSALPQIEVLPEISITGAAGAYAAGTKKILLLRLLAAGLRYP